MVGELGRDPAAESFWFIPTPSPMADSAIDASPFNGAAR